MSERLLVYYATKGDNLSACGQDTLNDTLRERIMTLSPKYNFLTNYRYFRYETLAELNASYEVMEKQEYEVTRRHPVVIHYVGDKRPWTTGNQDHYQRYYEICLSRTLWKGTPKETGKELYMVIHWGMSHVTWPCPPVRMRISRQFGMKVTGPRKRKKKR